MDVVYEEEAFLHLNIIRLRQQLQQLISVLVYSFLMKIRLNGVKPVFQPLDDTWGFSNNHIIYDNWKALVLKLILFVDSFHLKSSTSLIVFHVLFIRSSIMCNT